MKTLNDVHKILIAVEDSQFAEKSASYGFDLAKKLGAEVGLIHVNDIPTPTPYSADPLLNEQQIMVPELMHVQEEASKKLLDRIADRFGQGLTIYTFLKMGNTRDEILNTADEWKADLIILGTHGRSGIDLFFSGSIAEKVVRKARCPVLIIPNKEPE